MAPSQTVQEKAPLAELDSFDGNRTDTAMATARGKLLEFAMILREWDRAEKPRPELGTVDKICKKKIDDYESY